MKRTLRSHRLSGLAVILFLASCGSDTGGSTPVAPVDPVDPPGVEDEDDEEDAPGPIFAEGGEAITYPEMLAALEGIRDVFGEVYHVQDGPVTLAGVDERDAFLTAQNHRIADAIRELPDVALATVLEGDHTVTAVLKNGLHVVVINNRPVGMVPDGVPAAVAQELVPPHRVAASPAATGDRGVPGGMRALVTEPFGGGFAAPAGAMAAAHGYEVNHAAGTEAEFAAIQGYGLVYIDTHGGVFITLDEGGFVFGDEWLFVLQTSTEFPQTAGAMAPYLQGFTNREFAVSVAPPTSPTAAPVVNVGITSHYIRNRWQLDDAVVILHVCQAGRDEALGTAPPLLRAAIFDAGAATLLTLDDNTDTRFARASMEYFLDRVLGHNEIRAEDPHQRPFGAAAVWEDMGEQGLQSFTVGGRIPGTIWYIDQDSYNVNWVFEAQGDYGALRPSIERMEVNDDPLQQEYGLLTLHGIFGPREGTVEVGSEELALEAWTPGEIVARLPTTGPAASGTVEVHHLSTKSNPANLTQWSGSISTTFHVGLGDLRVEADADVLFRADARPFRMRMGEKPEAQSSEVLSHLGSSALMLAAGQYAQGGASITYSGGSEPQIPPRAVIDGFLNFQAQAPAQAVQQSGDAGTGMYFVVGEVDPEAGRAQLCIHLQGVFTQTIVYPPGPGSLGTQVADGAWQIPAHIFDEIRGSVGCLNLAMGEDLVIPRVDRTLLLEEGAITFRAGPFTPSNVPHSEHAR